jgi:glycosyltransferase involved in cell wall biosynthesis
MLAKLFCYLNKNRLIVDIADIRRKQSQALGYKLSKIHYVGAFIYEWLILSMADEIWFASKRMACYERKIFKFKKEKVKIVINTGVLAEDYPIKTLEQGKFRFVCAGGLSKNRGAEFLIKAYLLNPPPNSELHLCGEGGEWIQERFDSDKITFWGSLSESEAISLLRACDCGVIPYPNQFYYNMIFPSKLSLYITCGLPVTAFRGSESGETIERGQIGLTFDDNLSDLNGALHKISMPDVYSRLKENVIKVKFKYINSYVYKEAIKGMK